ncbi:MAG: phosphoribosylanthranilate isomerase [Candidatus Methanomethylophilaceae archaeon]|nr:phosphoribosylanthranilate isomerase [Candidatus Methanomethylophilaceae archaeon]
MTLVKLCGLRTLEDIRNVNEARPDMAGMVLSGGFRRSVPLCDAERMVRGLSGDVVPVGVFVDEPLGSVAEIAEVLGLGAIQLHGSEDPGYIERLRSVTGTTVIKSFPADDIREVATSPADLVLMDPGRGSGETFDWSVLRGMDRRFILAGGLTPDNVADAVRIVRPYAVDTSSGIEVGGVKDRGMMIRFVEEVRMQDRKSEGMR